MGEVMEKASGRGTHWQYMVGIVANISAICSGMSYGWPSPGMAKLTDDSSHVPHITPSQSSWIVSCLMMGGLLGCVLTSFIVDRIGRKKTMMFSMIPFSLSWILIYFATSVSELCVARFLSGVSVGTVYSVIPTYLGEIMNDDIRGSMTSLIDGFLNMGILFEYIVGSFVSFHHLALISLAIPLINLVFTLFLPESPYYLVIKRKKAKAERTLKLLKNNSNVDKDLMSIEEFIKSDEQEKSDWKEMIKRRGNIKGLAIVFGLMAAQQFTGVSSVLSYAQNIFEDCGGSISAEWSSVGIGSAQVLASLVCSYTSDRFGRRKLLLVSISGCFFTLFTTGFIFFLLDVTKVTSQVVRIIPTVSLIFFMLFISSGMSTQPHVYMSELFKTNFKAFAVCAGNICMFSLEALNVKIFEMIMTAFGYCVIFWFLAGMCLFSGICMFIFVPETKGKSFREIQQLLDPDENHVFDSELEGVSVGDNGPDRQIISSD